MSHFILSFLCAVIPDYHNLISGQERAPSKRIRALPGVGPGYLGAFTGSSAIFITGL
jgi:hypothetical protein